MELSREINLEKAFSVATSGIIRASIFSGFVLNPKNEFNIVSWHINEAFKLCGNDFNDKSKNDAYNEFKKWVVKNSLREMMEYLDYSLIDIFKCLYIIIKYPNIVEDNILEDAINDFKNSKNGFPEKIDKINKLVDNKLTNEEKYWKALQKIRNVITHNLGISNKKIKLSLPEVETIVKDRNGKECYFKPGEPIDMAKYLIDPIKIKIEYKTRSYKQGEYINFSNEDIMYIIWGMQQALGVFEQSIIKKAFELELPIIDKTSNKIINKLEDYINDKNLLKIETYTKSTS